MGLLFYILVFSTLFFTNSLGGDPSLEPLFGPEFTFTNQHLSELYHETENPDPQGTNASIAEMKEKLRLRILLARQIQKRCLGCTVIGLESDEPVSETSVLRVRYPDGYWFHISADPGVIEIQAKPTTLGELEHIKDRLQKDLFNSAREIGLDPFVHESGGGHINIGFNFFEQDALLFRNFIVDYANHPELALGIFERDIYNAPPISIKKQDRKYFQKVIARFDQGEIKSAKELVFLLVRTGGLYSTNSAMNLTKIHAPTITSHSRVEIRAFRAQSSADEYLLQCRLLAARIAYLKKLTQPIPLQFQDKRSILDMIKGFQTYVTETGLDWKDFQMFIPQAWKRYLRKKVTLGEGSSCMIKALQMIE